MIRRISILLFIGLCWGQEIVEIKTGSFFGECLGYCISELTITESQADYNIYGWDENDPVYLPVEISDSVDSIVWEDLNTEFNFELFMSLDSIIGCPDCVDGGAEWFEIVTIDTLKRVTIEYGDSLNGLDSYINLLRTIRQSFEEIQKCYYTPNPGVCLAAITKYYFVDFIRYIFLFVSIFITRTSTCNNLCFVGRIRCFLSSVVKFHFL